MMFRSVFSKTWLFGFILFVCQIVLLSTIMNDILSIGRESKSPFDVPFRVDGGFVRFAQLVCFLVVIATQRDIGEAVGNIISLRKQATIRWDEETGNGGNSGSKVHDNYRRALSFMNNKWLHLLLPNILKLAIGILTIFGCFVVIVQHNDVFDMFMKVVTLLVIAEMDRIAFNLAARGSFGIQMQLDAEIVNHMKVNSLNTNIWLWENIIILITAALIFTSWIGISIGQENGTYFRLQFPNCRIGYSDIRKAGDGVCDEILNNVGCEFDMGDCVYFNLAYKECKVPLPSLVGNGVCDGMVYNTEECHHDGMDCFIEEYPDCYVEDISKIGNGVCNGGDMYNTKECGHDGGDCFISLYPDCYAAEPSKVGDGNCDAAFNTAECGHDGMDCFIDAYPACFVAKPNRIGNGKCDQGYSALCGFDGGDCQAFQFGKDKYAIVTAESIAGFMYENSELSFYYSGQVGHTTIAVKDGWGYLFDRSVFSNGYYYGLWSYIYENGDLVIGWRQDVTNDIETKVTCENALENPNSTDPRFIKFVLVDLKVTLYIDDVEKCSAQISEPTTFYHSEDLYLGGAVGYKNHIYADLVDVKLKYKNLPATLASTGKAFEYYAVFAS